MIYERRDLPDSSHKPERPLEKESRYFWSVRARFNLDGNTKGTKWGYFRSPQYDGSGMVKKQASPGSLIKSGRDACTLDFIPTSNYYRFQTP